MRHTHETLKGSDLNLVLSGLDFYAESHTVGLWPRICERVRKNMIAARDLMPPRHDENMLEYMERLVAAGLFSEAELSTNLAAIEISANAE